MDALLGDYRTASAQDTQTQAAITGALLAYRTGPDQDVFTINQITLALVAYRSAADQDTATASSIAAALLSYYTIAQVDGGLRHDPERLRLEHRAHLHADAGETLLLRLPVPAGHGLQLGDVRQRGRQQLRGRHRHLPRHLLALTGSATLDGLTAQGNVGCDQLLCNDVNCTDVFITGVDASGAACAALTATGAVAGAALSSTGAVSGSSLSISGAASVGLLSSATGITGSTLTINNTANAGNFTTVGDVSTGTLTASGAATAASFGRHADRTGASAARWTARAWTAPSRPRAAECRRAAWSVSAPQLFASNTLTVTNTSDFSDDLFLTKNWAGWSKLQVSNNSAAPDSGPELRLLGNQSAGLPGAGRRGAPVRADHDQRRGAGADEEPLHAAVPDHELEEPRLPCNRGQHGQRGLQHKLHVSDSRVKTEIAEADVAEPSAALQLRGGQAVQAPGHERGPKAGLRLTQLCRNEVEEFDGDHAGERRHGDGHPRLLSPYQRALGGVQELPGPDKVKAWQV